MKNWIRNVKSAICNFIAYSVLGCFCVTAVRGEPTLNGEQRWEQSAMYTESETAVDWVDYVNPLMGTASTPELSAGNTYPTISLPFGMNTWSPQTGTMNDGGLYTYTSNYLYGIRQTRQASYWIKDYGQFALMPVNSKNKYTAEKRKSWFSHKAETVHPYYYKVYLPDHHSYAELSASE